MTVKSGCISIYLQLESSISFVTIMILIKTFDLTVNTTKTEMCKHVKPPMKSFWFISFYTSHLQDVQRLKVCFQWRVKEKLLNCESSSAVCTFDCDSDWSLEETSSFSTCFCALERLSASWQSKHHPAPDGVLSYILLNHAIDMNVEMCNLCCVYFLFCHIFVGLFSCSFCP